MIGESSGVSTLINNERIVRDTPVQSGSRKDVAEESAEQNYGDVTSFSPQALALARNVSPAGASSDQGQSEPQGRGQGGDSGLPSRLLDIRV